MNFVWPTLPKHFPNSFWRPAWKWRRKWLSPTLFQLKKSQKKSVMLRRIRFRAYLRTITANRRGSGRLDSSSEREARAYIRLWQAVTAAFVAMRYRRICFLSVFMEFCLEGEIFVRGAKGAGMRLSDGLNGAKAKALAAKCGWPCGMRETNVRVSEDS